MAISSGAGPHRVFLVLNGATFALDSAEVSLEATKKSGTFSASLPLRLPGARQALGPSLGDNTASIVVSTRGQQATLIAGEIDSVNFDYIGGMIKVSGRDASAKLHGTKSAEKFVNQSPSAIISTIAGRVGLSANVDASALKAGKIVEIDFAKMTDNVSLAHVVHKLADFLGAHWYVAGGQLVVTAQPSSASPYTINFNDTGGDVTADVKSLTISRNVQAGKGVTVNVKSWNSRKKAVYSGTYSIGGAGTSQNYNYHLPGLTQDHANQHAKAKAKDQARHELTLSAELVGDPTILVSQPLLLVGTEYAQTFKIDSISHKCGMSGHTMSISAKSAAASRSGA